MPSRQRWRREPGGLDSDRDQGGAKTSDCHASPAGIFRQAN